ncbi:MAG TPA: alpha/beta hydrolase [Acidimicrobiales bacterium]|jgi:proline iminopeptidase|nr:alpha/beta hydrolase [Acidimicrobiales bacterium]
MTSAEEYACFPKDRFITTTDGTPIAYTVVGDGALSSGRSQGPAKVPILFVNGWSCTDTYWSVIAPAVIESGHTAVLVDTRGHGQSGLPRPPGYNSHALRPEDVSVERVAADFLEVLDDAGIEVAALVGHSIGVQLIFEIYRQAPDRVAALLPVAGTFENPVQTFADQPVMDRLFPIADVLFRVLPFGFLQPVVRRISAPETALTMLQAIKVAGPKVTAERIGPHVTQIASIDFSVLWRMIGGFRNHHAVEMLPGVTAPTLIFAGGRDFFAPPVVQRRMHALIPDSEIVWFEEGGHMLPAEEPDSIAAGIVDFLVRRPPLAATAGIGAHD